MITATAFPLGTIPVLKIMQRKGVQCRTTVTQNFRNSRVQRSREIYYYNLLIYCISQAYTTVKVQIEHVEI